jgi:hypothetical protein
MRNEGLEALAKMLQEQHAMKHDVIVSAAALRSQAGRIVVEGDEPILSLEGVTAGPGVYDPTEIAVEGFAEKLGITPGYLKKLHSQRVDLFDANVNGWLQGRKQAGRIEHGEFVEKWDAVPGDPRSFLLRTFRPENGDPGIARALLSDKYQAFDNLDVLMSVLEGVRESGAKTEVRGCDLTDRRMYVRIAAPEVAALAPVLLKGYRSPFTGDTAEENPLVFAGFVASNSEVGDGAWSITPRLEIQVCSNGMTISKDAMRGVHIGGKKSEGIVQWSGDTLKKELDVIRSKCRDMVSHFLNVDYVTKQIELLEEKADKPVSQPEKTVTAVGKQLSFSQDQISGVLEHFIKGGQLTAGGVMQAVTSYAQVIGSADTAAQFEAAGVRALELAAAH